MEVAEAWLEGKHAARDGVAGRREDPREIRMLLRVGKRRVDEPFAGKEGRVLRRRHHAAEHRLWRARREIKRTVEVCAP